MNSIRVSDIDEIRGNVPNAHLILEYGLLLSKYWDNKITCHNPKFISYDFIFSRFYFWLRR